MASNPAIASLLQSKRLVGRVAELGSLGVFASTMSRSISERDWKVFGELRKIALERLCDRVLNEANREIGRAGKTSHERYLSLYQLVQKRDEDIARGFNDFRRSTALTQIGTIHSMGLFTGEELRRFSPETIQVIELYGPIPDA